MSSSKPDFKPDLSIGEGVASKSEVNYRETLLSNLESVYKDFQKIKKSNDSADDKISEVDKIIDTFILDSQSDVNKELTDSYKDGATLANTRLKKIGAVSDAIIPGEPESLQNIIKQQSDNVEDVGLVLRGRLRQIIRLDAVMGNYGQ